MAAPTVVAVGWTLRPARAGGRRETGRAAPRPGMWASRRAGLYELGCTLAPLDARRVGGMVGLRVVAAAGAVVASLALALKHTVATWLEHGVTQRAIAFSWVLAAACLALDAARRVRDIVAGRIGSPP